MDVYMFFVFGLCFLFGGNLLVVVVEVLLIEIDLMFLIVLLMLFEFVCEVFMDVVDVLVLIFFYCGLCIMVIVCCL